MAKNTLRGLFTQGRVEQLSSRIDLIERILESIVEGKHNPQPAPWEEERLYGVAHRPGWVDPAVNDRTLLTVADLQNELHQISAERIRLDAREREVLQRLAEMKAVDAPKEG